MQYVSRSAVVKEGKLGSEALIQIKQTRQPLGLELNAVEEGFAEGARFGVASKKVGRDGEFTRDYAGGGSWARGKQAMGRSSRSLPGSTQYPVAGPPSL